ncbi:MAG: RNA polymerase sigma factor [Oscillospiraceae bacterium]|nr:RNA polymerase sigma factor [Oscillospiraceae bacterium]
MTDFQEVYDQYFKDVYKYALSLCRDTSLAEEITQETFFKALKNIDSFKGQCRLYVWLCQIAKNTYYSYSQKSRRTAPDQEAPSQESLEEHLITKESAFEIHKILHSLQEPYKEVFSLRVFGELSFSQISILFGKTESWARVTYHRARLKIKEEIK